MMCCLCVFFDLSDIGGCLLGGEYIRGGPILKSRYGGGFVLNNTGSSVV